MGKAVEKRPVLALYGMNVITQWAQTELSIQQMFISMLGSNPGPAASIFTTLRNNNFQREAMMNVAQNALDEEDLALFETIVNFYQSAAGNRDKIAHHVWAVDEQFEDAVILVDPRKLAKITADTKVMLDRDKADYEEIVAQQEAMRRACTIWKQKDFQDTAQRISRVSVMAIAFSILLPNAQRSYKDEKARDVLLRMPEIREALDRNAQRQKTSP